MRDRWEKEITKAWKLSGFLQRFALPSIFYNPFICRGCSLYSLRMIILRVIKDKGLSEDSTLSFLWKELLPDSVTFTQAGLGRCEKSISKFCFIFRVL